MAFAEADLQSVVGRRFPGGSYTVEPWRAWLLADCVLAGQHLRVRGTVSALREEDGARLADCDVVLEVVGGDPGGRAGGDTVVSGTATVVLP